MNHHIDIQHASNATIPVTDEQLTQWAQLTLDKHHQSTELTIRIVASEEMRALNHTYRQQNKTTNVLAFPAQIPEHIQLDTHFLGDVIICPNVLIEESVTLQKPLIEHWAHIVIHGILHLLGFDHIEEKDAVLMQKEETLLLNQLGFANPYLNEDNHLE